MKNQLRNYVSFNFHVDFNKIKDEETIDVYLFIFRKSEKLFLSVRWSTRMYDHERCHNKTFKVRYWWTHFSSVKSRSKEEKKTLLSLSCHFGFFLLEVSVLSRSKSQMRLKKCSPKMFICWTKNRFVLNGKAFFFLCSISSSLKHPFDNKEILCESLSQIFFEIVFPMVLLC